MLSGRVRSLTWRTDCPAQWYDANISLPGCDKNMPGVILAMARLNRPSLMVYGGTIKPGVSTTTNQPIDVVSAFQSYGEPPHYTCSLISTMPALSFHSIHGHCSHLSSKSEKRYYLAKILAPPMPCGSGVRLVFEGHQSHFSRCRSSHIFSASTQYLTAVTAAAWNVAQARMRRIS